jgi:6,7-dimethyl-8-ribityllumazine synthase
MSEHSGAYLILTAQFNSLVTERLAAGARDALQRAGVPGKLIEDGHVAGAWELPPVAAAAARSGRYAAIIACGAVIRGETPHFDHVARTAVDGLAKVQFDTLVPVGLALLTTDTLEQALNRAGGKAGNKGGEAALAALESVEALQTYRDRN